VCRGGGTDGDLACVDACRGVDQLAHGACDIGGFQRNGAVIVHQRARLLVGDREIENVEIRTLFDVEYVVAMRKGHPAVAAFDLDAWLAYPHVVVSGRGHFRTPLNPQLAVMGYRRRVGLVVPIFQLVPAVLAATDMIAMIPRQSIAAHAHLDLVVFPPPVAVDGFTLNVAWHARQNLDRAVQYVCRIVRETFETSGVQSVMPRGDNLGRTNDE
jgi:DNA-binding transcriptional LysR family regulator